jgi:hypothetical protein
MPPNMDELGAILQAEGQNQNPEHLKKPLATWKESCFI